MTTTDRSATRADVDGLAGVPDDLSIELLQEWYREHGYVADRPLAAALFLSLRLERPLLLEGEAGVGKTEVAKVLARVLGTRLIRLQCYEGLDVSTAVYEWNYPRQMLEIRLMEARGQIDRVEASDIFTERFLIRRPLLQAIDAGDGPPPVLLIDEVDRADEEFEAYLLELLAEYQVTVPELGSLRAEQPPHIVLTSNRTREVHVALKRRCLYHRIAYPGFDKELAIVLTRIPGVDEDLARRVVAIAQRLRRPDLVKAPGVAETLEWVSAILALGARELSPEVLSETFGVIVKYEEDVRRLQSLMHELLRPQDGPDAPAPA